MGRRRKKGRTRDDGPPAPRLTPKVQELLEGWAQEAAEAHGLVLYDVAIKGSWVMTVFVDRPGAHEPGEGVSVDELRDVSRYLEAYLDESEDVWEQYTLEVSSPGVERKLTRPRHYELSMGRDARIVVHEPIDGQNVFEGRLVGFDGQIVVLEEEEGSSTELELKNIAKARLTYEFSE